MAFHGRAKAARPCPYGRPAVRRRLPFATGVALLFALLAEPTPSANAGAAASHGIPAEPRPLLLTLGLPPEQRHLYDPQASETFSCLDGKMTLQWSAVNDDYCDCKDGSDEPGTSACPNGRFYCRNKGHIPGVTLSSRVNDGVCEPECCDGSDEYSGRVSCPDSCAALAEEYHRNRKEIDAKQRAGYAIKQGYSSKGRKLKADRKAEIEKLKAELEEAKLSVARAQSAKEQMEKDEQARKAQQGSGQCKFKNNFGRCVDHLRQAVNQLQEHREQITTLLGLLSSMKRDHNQNYHDMAVKEAITGYDEFVEKHPDFSEEAKDAIEGEILTALEGLEAVEEDVGAEQGENSPPGGRNAELEKVGISSWVLGVVTKLQAPEIVIRPFQSIMRYFTESRAPSHLRDSAAASSAHSSALNKQADVERKISDLNKRLEFDFGRNEEWAAIEGERVEYTFGKYTYEVYFFGEASQKSKDGEFVSIGRFSSWAPGLEKDDPAYYRTMLFKGGARCWNGPERSITLSVECGARNELDGVAEPEKCEYTGRLLTPAACNPVVEEAPPSAAAEIPAHPQAEKGKEHRAHDEF